MGLRGKDWLDENRYTLSSYERRRTKIYRCDIHKWPFDFPCRYCRDIKIWKQDNIRHHICNKHRIAFTAYDHCSSCTYKEQKLQRMGNCEDCTLVNPDGFEQEYEHWDASKAKAKERGERFDKALAEQKDHQNEKCLSCGKPIIFDEWFCYCCLCPDCYMKNEPKEEDYDEFGDLRDIV